MQESGFADATNVDADDFANARQIIGMTREELADVFGLDVDHIAAMEQGQIPIDKRTALAMAYLVIIARACEEAGSATH